MIMFGVGEVTALFDGTIAVGGCRRQGIVSGESVETWNITLQNMREKKDPGTSVSNEDLYGPEIYLAFKNELSIDVLIHQLTELKERMRGKK